jgi:hypothetical protein
MIIVANKSAAEIVDDESKKAFYVERFPITVKVKWKNYNLESYLKFLNLLFPKEEDVDKHFLASLFQDNFLKHNNWISPRQAINIADTYFLHGHTFFNLFKLNIDGIVALYEKSKIEAVQRSFKKSLDFIYDTIIGIEDIKNKLLAIFYTISFFEDVETNNDTAADFKKFKELNNTEQVKYSDPNYLMANDMERRGITNSGQVFERTEQIKMVKERFRQ